MVAAPRDALGGMRALRLAGCQSHAGTRVPIRISAALNAAADQWSRGTALKSAIERTGYRQDQSGGLHAEGTRQALGDALRQRGCGALTDPTMIDAVVVTRGEDVWI